MKLSFEEAIENHRKMWNWIADETERRKEIVDKFEYMKQYIDETRVRKLPMNHCFCCEYGINVRNDIYDRGSSVSMCAFCPIVWTEDDDLLVRCCDTRSLYDDWCTIVSASECSQHRDYGQAAVLAREIANLPAREKVKEDELYASGLQK